MTDKKLNKISAPKGVPDYVPPNSAQFIAVRDTFAHHIRLAGYEHIELPIFEDTTLFARGLGNPPTWCPKKCTPSLTGVAAP